ncbi:MAG: biotin/lipoyl-containing protein, partial [Pseudomonadota bacterium]
PLSQTVALIHGADPVDVTLSLTGPNHASLTTGGTTLDAERRSGAWWIDGAPGPRAVRHASPQGAQVTVFDGAPFTFDVPDPLDRGSESVASGDAVLAPMPGLVRSVHVAAGQSVRQGQRLTVLEAMKMEHALTAPRDGVVEAVLVAEGAQVAAGDALVHLVTEAEEAAE